MDNEFVVTGGNPMITFRRALLDQKLTESIFLMRGRVLDIGGTKSNKRGSFIPPVEKVEFWKYLNPDPAADADYICSADIIPLDNESIETVIMTEVLEYLEYPQKVLSEIYRILSPQGICLISLPLLHAVHSDWQEDRQRYTAVKINEMAREAGFPQVEVRAMGGLGSVIYDLIHVSGGYANQGQNCFAFKILAKLARMMLPLFRLIDRMARAQQDFITTGYFVVLQKNNNQVRREPWRSQEKSHCG